MLCPAIHIISISSIIQVNNWYITYKHNYIAHVLLQHLEKTVVLS